MLKHSSKVFQELHELIRIMSSLGPLKRRGLSLDVLQKNENTYARLYRLIEANPAMSEETAFKEMLLVSSSKEKDHSEFKFDRGIFNGLKSRLKAALIDSLFLLDLDVAGHSKYSVSLYSVNRMVFLARVLNALSARELAMSVAKAGLTKALFIEEWSCAMEFLFILRRRAGQSGDTKAHHFYLNEYLHCRELLAAEQEAECEMENLQLLFARAGGEKPKYAVNAEMAACKVDELAVRNPGFKLHFLALRLHTASAQMRMDHAETIKICDKAFQLLNSYPSFSNRARQGEYAIMMFASAVQIRDDKRCQEAHALCQSNVRVNENNWFTYKQYEFLWLMHKLEFQSAYAIINDVFANERFRLQTQASQEKWELFRMYSEYVSNERVPITTPEDFNALIPILTPDKTGFNTSIILLHVLLLADRHQFAELCDRIDFLKNYKKRYLRGPENTHAAHFFSLLGLIQTYDLKYKQIIRRSSKMLVDLRRMEENDPIQGEQILPFSWMWEHLMSKLREYHHPVYSVHV